MPAERKGLRDTGTVLFDPPQFPLFPSSPNPQFVWLSQQWANNKKPPQKGPSGQYNGYYKAHHPSTGPPWWYQEDVRVHLRRNSCRFEGSSQKGPFNAPMRFDLHFLYIWMDWLSRKMLIFWNEQIIGEVVRVVGEFWQASNGFLRTQKREHWLKQANLEHCDRKTVQTMDVSISLHSCYL